MAECKSIQLERSSYLIMSLSQLIQQLAELIGPDPDALELLTQIHQTARKLEPDFSADAVEQALDLDDWRETIHDLLDELEQALKKFFVPHPDQVNAFNKDMLRWFEYMRAFVELDSLDGAKDIMTFYWKIFHADSKKICGSVRSRCANAGKPNTKCTRKLTKGEYICENCGTPRTLCRRYPMANGRCGKTGASIGHGGHNPKGALASGFIDGRHSLSRGNMFAKQMEKRPALQKMFVEALQDPDYLSLNPEMALLAARRGELIFDLDALDPQEIENEVRSHIRELMTAIRKDKLADVQYHASEIENLLEKDKNNRERWREMHHIAGQMARLADVERKRIVEARRSVPIEEMINLQNETIKAVRNAINSGAEELFQDFQTQQRKGNLDKFKPEHIRSAMLRHLATQLRPVEEREQAALAELTNPDAS